MSKNTVLSWILAEKLIRIATQTCARNRIASAPSKAKRKSVLQYIYESEKKCLLLLLLPLLGCHSDYVQCVSRCINQMMIVFIICDEGKLNFTNTDGMMMHSPETPWLIAICDISDFSSHVAACACYFVWIESISMTRDVYVRNFLTLQKLVCIALMTFSSSLNLITANNLESDYHFFVWYSYINFTQKWV